MNMKLFDSEQKVMDVLWREGDLHAGRIAEIPNDEIAWNRNTTYTVIKKCIEKGAIERQEPKQKNKHQGLSEQPPISHALFRCSATTPANTLCPSAFICS